MGKSLISRFVTPNGKRRIFIRLHIKESNEKRMKRKFITAKRVIRKNGRKYIKIIRLRRIHIITVKNAQQANLAKFMRLSRMLQANKHRFVSK